MHDTIKVGIAENDIDLCKEICAYFSTRKNIEIVFVVHNGKDAINSVVENPVDLLITDISSPWMDDIQVLERFKDSNWKYPKPKVIIVSDQHSEEFEKRVYSLGANYYMLKPLNLQSFTNRIYDLFNPTYFEKGLIV